MNSTDSFTPWIMLRTPSGRPASWASLARNTAAPGSRSDGFNTKVFPVTVARGNIQSGIIAGKLNLELEWEAEFEVRPSPISPN